MEDFFDELGDELEYFGTLISDHALRLVAALVILVLGWWLANLVRKLIDQEQVGKFLETIQVSDPIKESGYEPTTVLATIGGGVVFLATLVLAGNITNAEPVEAVVSFLVALVPRLIAAILVLVVAIGLAAWVRSLLAPYGEARDSGWFAVAARWVIVVAGLTAAIDFLGIADIGGDLAAKAVLATLLLIGVIAYGVGGIDTAKARWLERRARTTS